MDAVPWPAPDRRSIQSAWDAAVHPQSGLEARTCTLPEPPDFGKDAEADASSKPHSPAACDTCTRTSLATRAPVRCTGSALAPTLYWIVPSPWPEVPPTRVSQAASLEAVHWHSREVWTAMLPVPPLAGSVEPGAPRVTAHLLKPP